MPGSGMAGRYFTVLLSQFSTSDCPVLLVLSLSSLQADEGQALVLLPADVGGEAGEGGQHQALRHLCGLRDFPPVFPHLPCG